MAPIPHLSPPTLPNTITNINKRMTPLPLGPSYTTISIPASYGRLTTSPAPGTIAGIILGSVFGFIFLLYLLYLGLSSGRRFGSETQTEVSESSTVMGRRRRVRREEERPGQNHSNIVVEESVSSPSRSEGDVIEVIEEHSSVDRPARPKRHGRGGWRRERDSEGSEFSSRV
ncbi:hypothetical protein BDV29DRAFT_114986 [Aspergillus leporis]|uniref:Uncharacterized protein n=1 Tax=Aspergillus leporis TaxID=41062 RepID=A0A5N5X2H5_9EURO|nr:hypothetical protein BDV29DRAFT_114986 [Aspergillus leporis]